MGRMVKKKIIKLDAEEIVDLEIESRKTSALKPKPNPFYDIANHVSKQDYANMKGSMRKIHRGYKELNKDE
tara:strand:+ start:1684 stop:1896 length:213 start_codon:yes stop_codon:yes gene_type:complete